MNGSVGEKGEGKNINNNKSSKCDWSSFMLAVDMFSDDFMQDGQGDNLEQKTEDV